MILKIYKRVAILTSFLYLTDISPVHSTEPYARYPWSLVWGIRNDEIFSKGLFFVELIQPKDKTITEVITQLKKDHERKDQGPLKALGYITQEKTYEYFDLTQPNALENIDPTTTLATHTCDEWLKYLTAETLDTSTDAPCNPQKILEKFSLETTDSLLHLIRITFSEKIRHKMDRDLTRKLASAQEEKEDIENTLKRKYIPRKRYIPLAIVFFLGGILVHFTWSYYLQKKKQKKLSLESEPEPQYNPENETPSS